MSVVAFHDLKLLVTRFFVLYVWRLRIRIRYIRYIQSIEDVSHNLITNKTVDKRIVNTSD